MKCERCGISCMDAEDYRDHLPCPGSVKERHEARITQLETALRNMLADYWCTHSCMDCEGMGSCPGRESCQCSHCKGKALIATEEK